MVKQFLKDYLPSFIKPVVQSVYRKFKQSSPAEIEYNNKIAALKESHIRLNKGAKENEFIFREGMCLNIHPGSRFGFEHFCYISPEMVEEIDFFIEKTNNAKALLDIGALHGIFSLVFAINNPGKKVLAVDPSPIAFERLLYNINKNELHNITACKYALSDVSGMMNMHFEWEHAVAAGTNTLLQESFEVQKKAGDELCELLSFDPDVIKIDVEGHEAKVVKGLARTIEQSKPLVFLELHPSLIVKEGDTMKDLFLIFQKYGYKAFLNNDTIISFEEICDKTDITRILLHPPDTLIS